MWTKVSFWEKCTDCGQFIGFKNYVVSSPMGSHSDLEPPECEFLCLPCWDFSDRKAKELLYKVSYLKPIILREGVRKVWTP